MVVLGFATFAAAGGYNILYEVTTLIAALQTHARFFFLLVPRVLAGRCTPSRLASYAIALTASGNRRLGTWCWDRAIRSIVHDEPICEAILDQCIRAGQHDAAEEFANHFYDGSGLNPAAAVRLTGNLVLSNGFDSALRIYSRILRHCGDDIAGRSPAPARSRSSGAPDLRSLLAERAAGTADAAANAMLDLGMARLCCSFLAFETSARLFERAGERSALDAEDRIAQAYALLRSGQADRIPRDVEALSTPREAGWAGADWQILLATVLFARGAADAAAAAVEAALRARFADHGDLERLIADCRRIVARLSSFPEVLTFSAGDEAELTDAEEEPGRRKLFVCGNGWSGSGALYDALTEYACLEMPDAPPDRHLNACTSNEMMFVQGPAGLGWIWRAAKQEGAISRSDLWELFRCHVAGVGAIGYTEHKCATAAANLLARLGGRYTEVFRNTYEAFTALPAAAPLSKLRAILAETTESLTGALAVGEGEYVVFNNAVFGRNLDMLEIFRNYRAAVVARDPLDQYADRRAQDLKHWMTPGRFVSFYRKNREAFHERKHQLPPEHAREVREIEFEQFVLDQPFRRNVIDWLLEGGSAQRVRHRFEPERSAKNIGIYARLLARDEREAIEKELARWRRS